MTDGLSQTLMIGEDLPYADSWAAWAYSTSAYSTCAIPPNVAARPGGNYAPLWWPNVLSFRSEHSGGVHFAFADGHVVFIAGDIDLNAYHAMATIAGGEQFDAKKFAP